MYLVADRVSPSRFNLPEVINSKAKRYELINDLERSKTKYIIYNTSSWDVDGVSNMERLPEVMHYISENYFKEKGCKLLETQYKNNKTKMKYTCKCGRNSEITFNHFLKDVRCRDCYKSECKGEMNPNWNPDRQQVKDNALFARKAYNSLHQDDNDQKSFPVFLEELRHIL
jgi:hypothetical protein